MTSPFCAKCNRPATHTFEDKHYCTEHMIEHLRGLLDRDVAMRTRNQAKIAELHDECGDLKEQLEKAETNVRLLEDIKADYANLVSVLYSRLGDAWGFIAKMLKED